MTIQLGDTLRNNLLDQIEVHISTTPILRIYTGTQPADCQTAASGTLLAEMNLPSDWMNAASGEQKTLLGTWQDASANADGTAGYFRIYNSGDTVCHMQGSAGDIGTEDLVLDNASIATGQQVTVTAFTITAPNP